MTQGKSGKSGGVAVLFSNSFTPFSFEVEKIRSGHILKVKVVILTALKMLN